jgi:hypothetical protein
MHILVSEVYEACLVLLARKTPPNSGVEASVTPNNMEVLDSPTGKPKQCVRGSPDSPMC